MRTDIIKINEKTPHQDLTEGLMVFAGGTSKLFNTGEWRTNTPVYVADKCKQCLLCTPLSGWMYSGCRWQASGI